MSLAAPPSGTDAGLLRRICGRSAYICGDAFSLADVAVAVYLAWLPYFVKCDPEWVLAARWPKLAEYVARVLARPAVGSNVPLGWLEDTAAWLL